MIVLTNFFQRGRLRAVIDRLFGYDVFISYRRRDASGYAEALAQALRARRLSVFLDQKEYGPGDRIDASTIRHVSMATVLVLLGSPAVLDRRDPDWILEEIKAFRGLSRRSSRTIIPVDFGGVLAGLPKESGLSAEIASYLRLDQPPDALASSPASEVLEAARRQFGGRTRDRLRLLVFQSTAAVLAFLLIAAIVFAVLRAEALDEATRRLASTYLAAATERLAVRRTNEAVALAAQSLSHVDSPAARRLIVETPILDVVQRMAVDGEIRELVASRRGSRTAAITGQANLLVWRDGSSDGSPRIETRGFEIKALAMSEDGGTIATVNVEKRVDLLDVERWQWRSCEIADALDGTSLHLLAIDSKRRKLFVAADDRILVFDFSTDCRKRADIPLDKADTSAVVTIAIAEERGQLAVVQTMSITIVDLSSDSPIARWEVPEPPGGVPQIAGAAVPRSASISSAAIDPVASQLAIGLDDGRLYVLHEATLATALVDSERRGPTSMYQKISGVAFSADGRWLYALQARGEIKIVRTYDLQIEHVVEAHTHSATHLAVRGDAVITAGLAMGGGPEPIKAWRVGDPGRRRRHTFPAGTLQADEQIVSLSGAPGGTDLAVSTDLGTVLVYDASTGANRRPLHRHRDRAPWVAFDPSGRFIASVSFDRDLHVADRNGKPVFSGNPGAPADEAESLYAGLWSPDGDFVVVADGKGTLRAHGLAAGLRPTTWPVLPSGVDALAWSSAPDRLMGVLIGQPRLVSVTRQAVSPAKPPFEDRITQLTSTANGRLFAVYGQQIEVWRKAGDEAAELVARTNGAFVSALSLDRSGAWLAVVRDDRWVWLYRAADLSLVATFMVPEARIRAVTITDDGWVAVGCDDASVHMFSFAELARPTRALVDGMRARVGTVTPDLKVRGPDLPPPTTPSGGR